MQSTNSDSFAAAQGINFRVLGMNRKKSLKGHHQLDGFLGVIPKESSPRGSLKGSHSYIVEPDVLYFWLFSLV